MRYTGPKIKKRVQWCAVGHKTQKWARPPKPNLKNKMAAVGEGFEKQDGVFDDPGYGFENKLA